MKIERIVFRIRQTNSALRYDKRRDACEGRKAATPDPSESKIIYFKPNIRIFYGNFVPEADFFIDGPE